MPNGYKVSSWTRNAVLIRDKFTCRYCGVRTTVKDPDAPTRRTVDHLIPRCLGGRGSFINLVTACKRCNEKKDRQSVKDAGMTLRPVPKHTDEEVQAHARFIQAYLNRCINCGRTSKRAHAKAEYHGGPKRCLTQNNTFYLSRSEYDYLQSLDQLAS